MEHKFSINYKKVKKIDLEKMGIQHEDSAYKPFDINDIQSYNPVYSRFFDMDETNYNKITLNHKYQIYDLKTVYDGNSFLSKDIFVKFSPLLDPLNYLRGKYDLEASISHTLPKLDSTLDTCLPKVLDINNSSYVDGLFTYLTSMMKDTHGWVHGVEYYGSFLGIQKTFRYNIADDLDFLTKCPFFQNNINKYFTIDNDASIIMREYSGEGSRSNKKKLSIKDAEISLDFEDITVPNVSDDVNDLPQLELEYESAKNDDGQNDSDGSEDESSSDNSESDKTEECEEPEEWETESESGASESDDSIFEEDVPMFSYLNNFPVQLIFQEKCTGTFDRLIMNKQLKDDEFIDVLMQIILILTTYQKVFDFTHNDLHTNNIMFIETDVDFLYYKVGDAFYKVPTNGRIFKLIDFGRAIYKFNNKLFCSDSFSSSGDAATQYNCEPYYNEKKPKIDPNPSFDLCRLGCSLFDFVCRDEVAKTKLEKIVDSWCNDDNSKSVLYKSNGQERYPDFKLYKMIARTVNNLTPAEQLKTIVFSKYAFTPSEELLKSGKIMDIDALPVYV